MIETERRRVLNMEDVTSKIQNKKSKMDKLLTDLSNEILTSVNFLMHLKSHSEEIVRNLNSKATPSVYFEEFVKANSLILKYLSFVTEINCKFEILEIPEKKDAALENGNDSTVLSTVTDVPKLEIHSSVPKTEVIPEINSKMKSANSNTQTDATYLAKPSVRSSLEQRVCAEIENKEEEIKSINISRKVGDEYEVLIESILSPSEFYIYIKNSQLDLFKEMLANLNMIKKNDRRIWNPKNGNKKTWLSQELGSYVLFYSKWDEIWHRAKVINWCLNYKDDFVKIFLLDYGEYKCVSIEDLEYMPEHIKKYPAFTIRCHLYGILPVELSADEQMLSWGKDSIERMQSLTETSKELKIRIALEDDYHPASSLPVTVWMLDENSKCVNELLVNEKYAIFDSNLDSRVFASEYKDNNCVENEELKNWNPMKEDYESYENCYELNVNDPAAYIYGYVGKDYLKVCKHFAKTGYCFKGDSCRLEHKKLDHLGFTTDQEEVYMNAFNSLPLPPLNSLVRVEATCLLGINHFCCILKDQNQFSDEENLESLLKFMNNSKNILEMKKLLIPPSTGQIVIAKYSEDQSWYRAKILESQPENDTFVVSFVDYGNKESVPLSHIRAIESRYMHLPFQALQCYIFGIEQNPKVSEKDAMNYLSEKILNSKISINIVSRLPGEDVSVLVNVFDEFGKNIGDDLLENDYAICKQEVVISNDSSLVPG